MSVGIHFPTDSAKVYGIGRARPQMSWRKEARHVTNCRVGFHGHPWAAGPKRLEGLNESASEAEAAEAIQLRLALQTQCKLKLGQVDLCLNKLKGLTTDTLKTHSRQIDKLKLISNKDKVFRGK